MTAPRLRTPLGRLVWNDRRNRRTMGVVVLALVVGLLVGLGVARDRGSDQRQQASLPTSTDAPALAPGQAAPGTANGTGAVVTVYGYSEDPTGGDAQPQPPDGNVFSSVDAQVCAEAAAVFFDPASLTLVVPEGTPVLRPSYAREPALGAADVAAHQCVRGYVTYQLPTGVRPIAVTFNDGVRAERWLVR